MATGKVTGLFSATGQSEKFAPDSRPGAPRRFNLSLWGTFSGSVQVERSFDGGTSWIACSRDGAGSPALYSAPVSLVMEEPEAGVIYRLN
ncbi:MAG TPA: hypothetical protein PKA17_08670, partial [Phenylobacterium sp.]|nr:hypothetical protein [Phenylobacterium sp.]